MTAYQLLPGLTPEEYAALLADIAANGVRVPIDVDENGQVLDGHHRSLIAAELGIDCPRRTVAGLTEAEKVAHALAVNVHRRSLSREQRRELLAVSLKSEPSASDVKHARRTGTSDKTAASVRRDLESTSEVPRLTERVGADGRTRPAVVAHTTTKKEQFLADRETGAVLSVEDWQKKQETADLDAQLEERMSSTDDRFLLNLARGLSACNGLLALSPQRAVETCAPGTDDHAVLMGFLNRMEGWINAVRRPTASHLRSVR